MLYQTNRMQTKNLQETPNHLQRISATKPAPQLHQASVTSTPTQFHLTPPHWTASQYQSTVKAMTGPPTQCQQSTVNGTARQFQQSDVIRPATHLIDSLLPHGISINTEAPSLMPPTPIFSHQDKKNDVDVPITPEHSFQYPCGKLSFSPIDQMPSRDFQESYSKSSDDTTSERSLEEDELLIDVVNDHMNYNVSTDDKSVDSSKSTSLSMSNQSSSTSSPLSAISQDSSPRSTTPEHRTGSRKKLRTNYTPTQVRTLEKVFNENPYPDIDTMEQLSSDLEVPEAKLKIWFQNKRARWRRRAENSNHAFLQYGTIPVSSSISPAMPYSPYGVVAPSQMMTAHAPQQQMPGCSQFYGYPTMTSSPALITRHNGHNSRLQQPQKHQMEMQKQQQQLLSQQPGSPHVYSQSTCRQQQPISSSPQQGQHPGHLQHQSPPQMYSPVAPSTVSPYSPLTQFSSYVYPYTSPYTYGQFPFYR